jgi:hypothetical protein
MDRYEKQKRYDEVIKAGVGWTTKHPADGQNDLVFARIAAAYLQRANADSVHAEGYIDEAVIYRDRVLSFVKDGRPLISKSWALHASARISESAGDISSKQHCLQYGNARVLLDRLLVLLSEVQAQHPNPTRGDDRTVEDARKLLDDAHVAISRVREKQVEAGCPTPKP